MRPQEVVASIQMLQQAYADYYAAIADYNRAQFQLYRALGQPAQILTSRDGEQPDGAACSEWARGARASCLNSLSKLASS